MGPAALRSGAYRFKNLTELVIASGLCDFDMRVLDTSDKGQKVPKLYVKRRKSTLNAELNDSPEESHHHVTFDGSDEIPF